MRNCKGCGKELTKRSQKIFCSQSCSARTNNLQRGLKTINCLQCDKQAIPKSPQQRFCSNRCQHLYRMFEAVKNNTASHKTMRRYLVHLYGEICLDPECVWDFSKRPIHVELEHRDGNYRNNTIDNCTLLCPNCHSLTPTYKAKNKGNGRHSRRDRYHSRKSY